jgi:hypothetical protein
MFILEYKGSAIGCIHIVEVMFLYIGIAYLTERYALEDVEEEILQQPVLPDKQV